jgi:cobalamin synthase
VGAGIGLLVISFFLFPTDGRPEWGKFWMVRPLIVVPFAGAMAGLCNYYILSFRNRFGLNKIVAIVLSLIVLFVGMWTGIVLGLDGTLWN